MNVDSYLKSAPQKASDRDKTKFATKVHKSSVCYPNERLHLSEYYRDTTDPGYEVYNLNYRVIFFGEHCTSKKVQVKNVMMVQMKAMQASKLGKKGRVE